MSFKLQSISAEAHELEAKVEAAEGRATKIAQVIAKHVEEIAKEIGGYVTISGGGHLNSVEGQPGDSVWLNVNSLPNPAKPTPSGLIPPEASGAKGKDEAAVIDFEKPVGFPGGTELTITLNFETGLAIGRSRISISTAETSPAASASSQLQAMAEILALLDESKQEVTDKIVRRFRGG